MAEEIIPTGRLRVAKSSADINDEILLPTTKPTMTGTERLDTIISIGFAAEEALPLGDVGTIGWCYVENLDDTNFVVIRMATGHTVGLKLKAGEGFFFRCNATAPYALADTAAVRIRWVVYED